jgi:hypothetical protein
MIRLRVGLVDFEINIPNRSFIGSYLYQIRKWLKEDVSINQHVGGLFPFG